MRQEITHVYDFFKDVICYDESGVHVTHIHTTLMKNGKEPPCFRIYFLLHKIFLLGTREETEKKGTRTK